MLSKKDILEILKELIINHDYNRLGTKYEDIHLDTTLLDLGFDSLDVTELSCAVEAKLGVFINDSEIEHVMMKRDIEGLMIFLYDRYKEIQEQEV